MKLTSEQLVDILKDKFLTSCMSNGILFKPTDEPFFADALSYYGDFEALHFSKEGAHIDQQGYLNLQYYNSEKTHAFTVLQECKFVIQK